MDTHEQKQIRPHHRTRLAVVYVRTARIPDDLIDYTNLKTQRDQARYARTWGWPEHAIRIIEDLGTNGTTADGREGYQRLCGMIAAGEVGLVLVADVSRLARCYAVFTRFLDRCRRGGVLLAANGNLLDSPRQIESPRRRRWRSALPKVSSSVIRKVFHRHRRSRSVAVTLTATRRGRRVRSA